MVVVSEQSMKCGVSARPPWHSILITSVIGLVSVASLPNIISSIDNESTREVIVNPLFENHLSRPMLGWIRIGFSFLIFACTLHSIRNPPWVISSTFDTDFQFLYSMWVCRIFALLNKLICTNCSFLPRLSFSNTAVFCCSSNTRQTASFEAFLFRSVDWGRNFSSPK